MMKNDCSVLVLSCDKNISLLNIFFDFFNKNWNDCPFPVYLGLETVKKKYDCATTLSSDRKEWGNRVKGYLEAIETKYVMLILDDFLPESKVDTEGILEFLEYMKKNDNTVTISMADIYDKKNIFDSNTGLCKRTKKANYLLNLQVGIWNKSVLIDLLRESESPWQTELFGSIRARRIKDRDFFCLKSDDVSPYKYNRGWLMVRGIWNGNEIIRLGLQKYADDLFDGKDIQYSNLMHIDLPVRIKRRVQIEYRKILSHLGIYL